MTTLGFIRTISIVAGLTAIAVAQTGAGARYGTHSPLTCASRYDPASGPISSALATKYFTCESEKEMTYDTRPPQLYVLDQVNLQVGKAMSYVAASGAFPSLRMSEIDINQPVYPIQGSYNLYMCDPIGGGNAGSNCTLSPNPDNAGVCYKTESKEWRCLVQPRKVMDLKSKVAPPK
jgi:hypothetical protein